MTDYKQLEQKVAELQKEIERLKKEEKENSLPDDFCRESAMNVLKGLDSRNVSQYGNNLDEAFSWISTSQGWDYWNERYCHMSLFTDKDYIQVQRWIILSYQREVK